MNEKTKKSIEDEELQEALKRIKRRKIHESKRIITNVWSCFFLSAIISFFLFGLEYTDAGRWVLGIAFLLVGITSIAYRLVIFQLEERDWIPITYIISFLSPIIMATIILLNIKALNNFPTMVLLIIWWIIMYIVYIGQVITSEDLKKKEKKEMEKAYYTNYVKKYHKYPPGLQ